MTEKGFKQIFPLGEKNDAYAQYFVGQSYLLILSILVDTFISKISLTMQPGPKIDSISGA